MQCASCQFENMPGSDLCGRCGSPLRLGGTAVDVHPPRAGRWTKRVRRVTPNIARGARAAASAAAGGASALNLRVDDPTLVLPVLARVIVPGWPQLYAGQRAVGKSLLYLWLLLTATWALLFYGTMFGSVLLGLAFSAHAASAGDALNRLLGPASLLRRTSLAASAAGLLFAMVYLPASRVLFRYADPVVIQANLLPFRDGDVLLVNRSAVAGGAGPRVGQVVLFEVQTETVQFGNVYYRYTGPRIDRVLAGPGDVVRWADRRLTVNGRPSTLEPLNPGVMPKVLDATVPADTYLIVPTVTVGALPPDARVLPRISLVPRDSITGVVYLRSNPLSRIRTFD